MSIALTVTSATVPSPLDCVISNANWQSLVELLQVIFPNDQGNFSVGNTEPPPARRGDPWFRYNADDTPDHWYVYAMGEWLRPHETAPGTVIMWEGLAADIPTFDGGEAGAVTAISGPMWERVTEMDGRFPIGPGTLPSTAVVGVGDTGGEETHALTLTEIPEHRHLLANVDSTVGSALTGANHLAKNYVTGVSGLAYDLQGSNTEATLGLSGAAGKTPVDAHNNMPPFRGIFFLRKSLRQFYRL